MKNLSISLILVLALINSIYMYGQEITLNGDVETLKTEKSINIEFNFDSLSVGKYASNEEYVRHKKDELNKKYPGRGDAWSLRWVEVRKSKYEPAFTEAFEKSSSISTTFKTDAKYTIILKITFIEPGFHVSMIAKENATVNAEAWVVESIDKTNILGKVYIKKAIGKAPGDSDEDTYNRISNAFQKIGDELGKFIKS